MGVEASGSWRFGGTSFWSERCRLPDRPSSRFASTTPPLCPRGFSTDGRPPFASWTQLAQWAGSRTDLFPPALCAQFGQLHSNGKPHSFAHTKRVVERAFDRPFDDVFESFEKEPIGCGAIAQVYKGVLKADILPPEYTAPKAHAEPSPTGGEPPRQTEVPTTAVALKVLHPNVHLTVARDLKIMHFFAATLNLLPGMVWLSLPEEVGVFGEMMNQQLDLRIESANLTRFEANFAHRRGAAVSFPRPVPNFGTRDLLVEEFEKGCPLKWFLRNGGAAYDPQLANMGLDAFLVRPLSLLPPRSLSLFIFAQGD